MAKRPSPHPPLPIITTVSSDGLMNVYNALDIYGIPPSGDEDTTGVEEDEEYQPIASWDSQGSRLVCCCVAEVSVPKRDVSTAAGAGATKKEEVDEWVRFGDGDEDEDGEASEGEVEGDNGMNEEEEEEEEQEEEEEEEEDELEMEEE